MNDRETKIQELKELLLKFRDDRDWKQFHDAKNIAEAISIEAGELQELFLWKDKDDVMESIRSDSNFKKEVEEELADIVCFCLNFANATDIDVSKIVEEKIKLNDAKYPAGKAKGTGTKYNKL